MLFKTELFLSWGGFIKLMTVQEGQILNSVLLDKATGTVITGYVAHTDIFLQAPRV